MCKRHVDGRGRVSDSRDQNIWSPERERFCYSGDFIAPDGDAAVIAGVLVRAQEATPE